ARHRSRPPAVRLLRPRHAGRPLPRRGPGAAGDVVGGEGRARARDPRARGGVVLLAHEEGGLPRQADRRDVLGRRRHAERADRPEHPPPRRRRPPAAAQPRQPRVHAARGRPLAADDARAHRGVGRAGAAGLRRVGVQAVPGAHDRDGDGRAARGRAAPGRVEQLDPAPVRRADAHDRARAGRAGVRGALRLPARAARGQAGRPRRRPHQPAHRRGAGRRPAVRRRAREPRPQRARRRRRHDAVAARAHRPAAGRAPRPVGARARRPRGVRAARGRGGAALRADHAVHGPDHGRGRRVPRRRVPGGDDRARRRRDREPRGRRGRRALPPRRRARQHEAADVRRGHPLLPRREPRARRAAGGGAAPRRDVQDDRARRRARVRHHPGDLRPHDPPGDPPM
ncbi:MAG: Putative cytochrome P450 hydroxylase, partial [uncultured Solirubrobacteraceae bacterium]